jgi:uncharacterized membrane protein
MSVRETHDHAATQPPAATYPGMWQVALGAVLAVLAPLAGFLGGTLAGPGEDSVSVDSLLAWLIGGLCVGGIGVLIALGGGLRFHRANRGG